MLEVTPFSFTDRRFRALAERRGGPDAQRESGVGGIIDRVASGGAGALLECVREANSPAVIPSTLRVSPEEVAAARAAVSERLLTALTLARVNSRKFHEYQRPRGCIHDDGDGVRLSRRVRPIRRVGVCAGRSFTALLACAVPALVAGVGEIALAAAPEPDGSVDSRLLAAAGMLGIEEIYRMDGPHAVAAFAYGAGPVRRVDKIVGPGGPGVTEAKRIVAGDVGVDAGLGLSELAVIADGSANARFIATDLLAQTCLDDGAGVAVLFTPDRMLAEAVRIEVERMADALPGGESLREALERQGGIYLCSGLEQAVRAVNALAPARLCLTTEHNDDCLADIETAGAVYLGPWTSVTAADGFSGLNPFLPVGGAGRFSSGLGVMDFVREISVVEYGPERLLTAGRHIAVLTEENGPMGAEALQERLEILGIAAE